MKDTEKRLRDFVKDNPHEVPEELSWDNFEDKAFPKKRRRLVPLLLFLLLCIIIPGIWWFTTNQSAPEITDEPTGISPEIVGEDPLPTISGSSSTDTKVTLQDGQEQARPQSKDSHISSPKKELRIAGSINTHPNENNRLSSGEVILPDAEPTLLDGFRDSSIIEIEPKDVLGTFVFNGQNMQPRYFEFKEYQEQNSWSIPFQKDRYIGLSFGTTLLYDAIPEADARYLTPHPGVQVSIHNRQYFKPNFFYEYGISYGQFKNLFRYKGSYHIEEFRKDELLARYYFDKGVVHEVREDTLVDLTVHRDVQTYNVVNAVQIPVSLGYTIPFKTFPGKVSVKAGMNMVLITHQDGKWVDSEKRVWAFSDSQKFYKTTPLFQTLLALGYTYIPNPSYEFFVGGQSSISLNSWNTESKVKPYSFNFSLGIRKNLDIHRK